MARAFRFAVVKLLSMNEADARILSSEGTLGLSCGSMVGDLGDNELTPYPKVEDDVDWDFSQCAHQVSGRCSCQLSK